MGLVFREIKPHFRYELFCRIGFSPRIVIFGMSWGASEAVTLARQLEADDIPVLLTVQVDSIAKIGEDDELIPANVSEAAKEGSFDNSLEMFEWSPRNCPKLANRR